MSDYREQCIEHKKVQAGIVDQRPVAPNSRKDRPVRLELFSDWWGKRMNPGWVTWGRYAKQEQAHEAARQLLRKYGSFDKTRYRVDGAEFLVEQP